MNASPSTTPQPDETPRFTDKDIKPYQHFPEQLNAGLIEFIQKEAKRRGMETITKVDTPKGGTAWTTWDNQIVLQCPPEGPNGEQYGTAIASYNLEGEKTN